MEAPPARYSQHAHLEQARKQILFTLLFYTGARVNELRMITKNDLINAVEEGTLKLVLQKQHDAVVRVLPTVARQKRLKLAPDIHFFFYQDQRRFLVESFRKPGHLMHEKAWMTYVNREMKKAKQSLQINAVLSSHSFRVGFITRHLKHAESHEVAQIVGHKNLNTTMKYNRYALNQEQVRNMLDKAYTEPALNSEHFTRL